MEKLKLSGIIRGCVARAKWIAATSLAVFWLVGCGGRAYISAPAGVPKDKDPCILKVPVSPTARAIGLDKLLESGCHFTLHISPKHPGCVYCGQHTK